VSKRAHDPSRLAGRFTVGRSLGSGTFGVVFEAQEEGRSARVALKKLSLEDAGALYDFKQEFRGLVDVVHPNLVALHELFADGPDIYLSMELVDGVGFLDHVHGVVSVGDPDAATVAVEVGTTLQNTVRSTQSAQSFASGSNGAPTSTPGHRAVVVMPGLDLARLRPALRQLAEGIAAIHRAGKLHRDLKPSNVLVTAEGQLKVLDFGLIASLSGRSSSAREIERRIVGTPAYMSPEQAMSSRLSPASDWYSLGVMLYEALTGRLPIGGKTSEILTNKIHLDPPDPRLLVADLPDDLCDLCVGLLQRKPSDRPPEAAILAALGVASAAPQGPGDAWDEVLPFVGRDHHLAVLEDAFTAARRGKAVTLQVHGTAGMGKTALLRRFLDDVTARDGAVVLEGRCYERESVPYKGVDSLIDALTQHLRSLPPADVAHLIPTEVQALARVFPVLLRVEAIRTAPKRADAPDPLELRRRAFGSLRELLARIASVQPLIVWIDDLQWGDADSAALLLDLLDPAGEAEESAPQSGAPALLLIASYRTEDAATIELVQALRERLARGEIESDVRELMVGPLVHREARALGRVLLAGDAEGGIAEQIAVESGGSPLFVHELARHVRTREPADAGLGVPAIVSLHEVLTARLARLTPDARRLLELIAVAGRPIAQSLVCYAAEIDHGAQVLAVLRSEHLIRSRAALDRLDPDSARPWRAEHADVECFHDRIRQTVLSSLSAADIARRHAGLAAAIEAEGGEDIDALFVHFLGAGDLDHALRFAEIAADRAEAALAFDRAAALYRKAIELRGSAAQAPQVLRKKLAHALANAGRGVEAARAYLDAMRDAPAEESRDLRRRAAEQLLRAGHIDEGLTTLEAVLTDVGLELPRTPTRALMSLMFRRAQLSLLGTGFTERDAASVPADDLARIDVCWSVGSGLGAVDIVRGADFQARHLLLALRAGEPYRIARALAWESILAAMEGGSRGRARGAALAARAAEIAERIQHPHALAWAAGAAAGVAYYDQRFREALALSDHAVAVFRATCTDITWEIGSIQAWWTMGSLVALGEIDELARRLPACLHEARELGALYNEASLRTYCVPRVHLAHDRPAEARRESEGALQSWSKRGWHTQHLGDLLIRLNAYLYESDSAAALSQMREDWAALDSSQLLRVEVIRDEVEWCFGNTLVLAARQGHDDREGLLREAERHARVLTKEKHPIARGYGAQLNAGIALARGRHDRALALYRDAAHAFEGLEMGLHAAASRRRQGELLGGEQGRELIVASVAVMEAQRIRNPERMAAMLAPV
jgi:serine/threonine protein kinase